ncbi:hypothetical protein RHMOL_Rhmol09G0143800 [Rhododendron molle]|uniref:Uncharacterized protein n=1 Tax=Rhododendron molle TaxID=49168 RepID=A0ACC0MF61_RHOML|nr:hypothetical protein RHMOL_Rhmol09G0143800 [Rhododendron molle]
MGLKDLKNKILVLGWKKSKDESVDRKPPAKPNEVKDQDRDKHGDQNKSREESTTSNITEKMKGVSVNDHEDPSSGPSQEADGAPTYASQQHYQDQGLEWRRYWRHASSGEHNWQENMTNDIVNDFFKPPY